MYTRIEIQRFVEESSNLRDVPLMAAHISESEQFVVIPYDKAAIISWHSIAESDYYADHQTYRFKNVV